MENKKELIASYILEIISAVVLILVSVPVLTGMVPYFTAPTFMDGELAFVPGGNLTICVAWFLLLVIGVIVIALIIRLISVLIYRKRDMLPHTPCILFEIFIGLLVLSAFLWVHSLALSNSDLTAEYPFYQLAVDQIGGVPKHFQHAATSWYVTILSLVLSFTGTKIMAAIVLQYVFQILSILFLYFSARRLSGVPAAVLTAGTLAVLPAYVNLTVDITPECFQFFLFSFGVYQLVRYIRYEQDNPFAHIIHSIALGCLFGILIYMDVNHVVLPLIVVVYYVFFVVPNRKKIAISDLVYHLISAFVVFFGCLKISSLWNGSALGTYLDEWITFSSSYPAPRFSPVNTEGFLYLQAVMMCAFSLLAITTVILRCATGWYYLIPVLLLFPNMLVDRGPFSGISYGITACIMIAACSLSDLLQSVKYKRLRQAAVDADPAKHEIVADDKTKKDTSKPDMPEDDSAPELPFDEQESATDITSESSFDEAESEYESDTYPGAMAPSYGSDSEGATDPQIPNESIMNESIESDSSDELQESDEEDSEDADVVSDAFSAEGGTVFFAEASDWGTILSYVAEGDEEIIPSRDETETARVSESLQDDDDPAIVFNADSEELFLPSGLIAGEEVYFPEEDEMIVSDDETEAEAEDAGVQEEVQSEPERVEAKVLETSRVISATDRTQIQRPAPGEPIHNPLPVPKRHEPRVMDFPYDIPEELMFFDIDDDDDTTDLF